MPHGHCLLWRPDLLFLHLTGDSLIAVAYTLIPFALVALVRKREDLIFNWVFVLFAAFILLCGLTHAVGIVNIWHGYYYLAGLLKLITGVVSIATAVVVWRLLPEALAMPSLQSMERRNSELDATREKLEESNRLLEARVAERTKELQQLVATDVLTGVNSRREIMRLLGKELSRSDRYDRPMSIMLVDIDHFKVINDRHGHQTGDWALSRIGAALLAVCRDSDSVGRYGGEEFLILCPETDAPAAAGLAERVRLSIAELHVDSQLAMTCSIGVVAAD